MQGNGGEPKELESWKEIAAYLGTSVRTVQRWEEQNGLPVKRVMREKRAAIYANPAELDAWVAQRTTLSAKEAPAEAERPGWPKAWMGLGVVVLLGLLAVGLFRAREGKPLLVAERVTSEHGMETQASVSPDGKWLVYVGWLEGRSGIRVKSLAGGADRVVVEGEARLTSPQWSRDGRKLAFLRAQLNGKNELLVEEREGGSGLVKVAEVMGRGWFEAGAHSYPAVQWTAGESLLVVDNDGEGGRHRIVEMDLRGVRRGEVLVAPEGATLHGFALSPDGRSLAVVVKRNVHYVLHLVELDEEMRQKGELRAVGPEDSSTESPGWLPNGELVYLAEDKQIWRMKRGGRPEPVGLRGEWPE